MIRNKLKLLGLSSLLLLSSLSSCGQPGDKDVLSKTKPLYQQEDHTDNYIDDNYKNYTQILVYSYARGDDSYGCGNLRGLINKLDYINDGNRNSTTSMHYDGIYLLPIFPSPSYHKYDAKDYYSIDPQYGTMADFDELVRKCKERGISIILDLAINHCSNEHPIFKSALETIKEFSDASFAKDPVTGGPSDRLKLYNEYIDWFNFTTNKSYASEDGQVNNARKKWVSIQGTEWYYEDEFAGGGMPDFNLDNPEVREELQKIMKFWLEKGVKGFRFDAVEHFYDDNKSKNYELISKLHEWGVQYSPEGNEYYMVCEGPWNSSLMNYYKNSLTDGMMNFYYGGNGSSLIENVCTAYTYEQKIQEIKDAGEDLVIDEDYNIIYDGFEYESGAKTFASSVKYWENQIKALDHEVIDGNFVVNHDTTRAVNQCATFFRSTEEKVLGLKLIWMLNNTLRGSTFMYYGEEIGMRNGTQTEYADPNKRHPMYWYTDEIKNVRKYAEKATPIPQYLPAVEVQMEDELSLLRFIMEINRMKAFFPEIARGTQDIVKVGADYLVMKKTYKESSIHLVYNFKTETNQISLDDLGLEEAPSEIKYSLSSSDSYSKLTSDTLNVPGYSITIL